MSTAPGPRPLGQRKKDYGLISDAQLAETTVATSRGLRHVRPYLYDFTAHCKRRWVDQPVLDVIASEFVGLSRADFERAIAQQRIRVNGASIDTARRFRDGDTLLHRVHRHEEPVSGDPLRLIHYDTDVPADHAAERAVIAVDKPPSIPVHPGGRFRHLALTFLLARELNLRRLFISHRLDRLTSGVVLFGTTPEAAAAVASLIRHGSTRKCYLALVRGHFAASHPSFVRVDEPIVVRGGYQGVCATGADGKSAITYIRALSYDATRDLSVVLCVPITGRTHQIRVHLQHLGFPIANDPLYGSVTAEKRGPILSDGKTKRAWQKDSFDSASRAAKSARVNDDDNDDDDNDNDDNDDAPPTAATNRSSPFVDDVCDFCVDCANPEDDPAPEALLIYLHAYCYTLLRPENGWPAGLQFSNDSAIFRAAVPAWCDGSGVTAASIDAALAEYAPDVEKDRIGDADNDAGGGGDE
jgi:RluA family pseudouridine synthase